MLRLFEFRRIKPDELARSAELYRYGTLFKWHVEFFHSVSAGRAAKSCFPGLGFLKEEVLYESARRNLSEDRESDSTTITPLTVATDAVTYLLSDERIVATGA
jgi:hypothetical protein